MIVPMLSGGIALGCQLLSGRRMAVSDIEALVTATGSREELIAHLIIDWHVLDDLDEAREALRIQVMAVKFSGGTLAETTPPVWPDELSQTESVRQLERFVCPPSEQDVASLLFELGPAPKPY
jgi:hypothetical protein